MTMFDFRIVILDFGFLKNKKLAIKNFER